MNIRERLAEKHSRDLTMSIVKFVGDDKERFKELVTLVLKEDNKIAHWAAWPMSYVANKYPQLLKPWISKLLDKLEDKTIHHGTRRNILRAFESIDIPEKLEGRAVDLFLKDIADPSHPPAITSFAITAATRICAKYPELVTELNLLLDPLRQRPQPASITVRLRNAAKALGSKM